MGASMFISIQGKKILIFQVNQKFIIIQIFK